MNTEKLAVAVPQADQKQKASALAVMAGRCNVEPAKLLSTLKDTVFKNASESELLALVVVSNEYGLSPFLREIWAFPSRGGGITPIVSVDGWIKITNTHPQFDGIEFDEKMDESGKPLSTTAIIYRKDRTRPIKITEHFSECSRDTDPWRKSPRRMLRHKALIQCARVAFGFSGIIDEDDAIEIQSSVIPEPKRPTNSIPVAMIPPPQQQTQTQKALAEAKPVELKQAAPRGDTAATEKPQPKELPHCRFCGVEVADMAAHDCPGMHATEAPRGDSQKHAEPEQGEATEDAQAAEEAAPEGFKPLNTISGNDAYNSVVMLANKSGVTEKQIMSILREKKIAREEQTQLCELAESKLLKVANAWHTHIADMRQVPL